MKTPKIVVVGLGYVGLPLGVALARHFDCIGVDIDEKRVAELRSGFDRTCEIDAERLRTSAIRYTTNIADCAGADVYIVTVPTPVDRANQPDLRPVIGATRALATVLQAGQRAIVVYESTVYPGVTEDLCGPEIERISGLQRGTDFFLGYSPERINPGDKVHTVDKIIKVIAGENSDVTEVMADIYGKVTTAGVFRAASIKAAEAAKVIENAQRDINIAFMNEISQIFGKMDLSIHDVLEAAGTKWNFLNFQPGLVGGHCIGVDPYYLSYKAQQLGHDPKVILAGRETNDGMARYIAEAVHARMTPKGSVLVLGLTFKEDVPDLRNSKVVDVIRDLESLGHSVTVHDPLADSTEAQHEYGIALTADALDRQYDAVVAAVPHAAYREMPVEKLVALTSATGLIADIKGIWRAIAFPPTLTRWQL